MFAQAYTVRLSVTVCLYECMCLLLCVLLYQSATTILSGEANVKVPKGEFRLNAKQNFALINSCEFGCCAF